MTSFWQIFWLEFRALARTRTLAMLMAAAVLWMLVFPFFVRGDGTAEGVREMYVHYSLGGVFALLVVSLLASATGSLARERATRRLQLTLVRPVRGLTLTVGKLCAHLAVGAIVLAIALCMLTFRVDLNVSCSHILHPVLPSARSEAVDMYEAYVKDPNTPEEVRKARKSVVLRLLENKARDHYQTVLTNETTSWRFALSEEEALRPIRVRLRFTTELESRSTVNGRFLLGGATGLISNFTQAVTYVPLEGSVGTATELAFENRGRNVLMIRPRRDIVLLSEADSFGWNLFRTYVVLLAALAVIIAFGVFLSAGLSRPVALFVAIVSLVVCEMSPSVAEQYPDELEMNVADRIGLTMARAIADLTHPVSSVKPLEQLAADECVEVRDVVRTCALDLILLPFLLSLLAAFLLPLKQDDL